MTTPEFMSTPAFPILEKESFRYVDTRPAADREPIVFLHGMLGDVSNWNETISAVHADGYRAIAPILPVYSIGLKHANLAGLVQYVHGFLDALAIEGCTLVGNSLGGHLAVLHAIRHPEHVGSLVLSGASGIVEVDLGSTIMRRQDRGYLRERIETTFYDPDLCTEQLLDSVIEIINTRSYVMRLIRIARSVQDGSVGDLLNRVDVPTLLIWGANDQITPIDVARSFQDGISSSELVTIDRCGHAPMMERPEQFVDHLLAFLESSIVRESHPLVS